MCRPPNPTLTPAPHPLEKQGLRDAGRALWHYIAPILFKPRSISMDMKLESKKNTAGQTVPSSYLYEVNAIGQRTSVGPVHDADGNLENGRLRTVASNGSTTTYNATLVWNAERCDRTGSIMDGGEAAARRVKHAMPCMLNQYTGATLKKTYLWGPDLSGTLQGAGGVGGLLSVKIPSGQTNPGTYYPTFDGNGNVSEYLASDGTVKAHFEYDPFGKLTLQAYDTANSFDAATFAHKFSTKYMDAETGLYYYGYRYYDPGTGRWMSRDPIGERGGANLYAFVGNDGVSRIDLLGENAAYDSEVPIPDITEPY